MQELITLFETMPIWHKVVWIVSCITFAWLLESIVPLVHFSYNKWKHAGVNFGLLGCNMVVNTVFSFLIAFTFSMMEEYQIGLLHWINLPAWANLILTILALDLVAQWFAHFILHKIKWMWKLHMVHHCDTKVDATTGTRIHPGDFTVRETLSLLVMVLMGAPVAFYLLYRFITIFFTYLSHANVEAPLWLDKTLSYVFVTPNVHKFHHHVERPWTDTNFGNIFSIWDRLFGTFAYGDPKKVQYGLDVMEGKPDQDFLYQLRVPFDDSIKTDY